MDVSPPTASHHSNSNAASLRQHQLQVLCDDTSDVITLPTLSSRASDDVSGGFCDDECRRLIVRTPDLTDESTVERIVRDLEQTIGSSTGASTSVTSASSASLFSTSFGDSDALKFS